MDNLLLLNGRWGLFHRPATLSFDSQKIEYRSGRKRISAPRGEVAYAKLWLTFDTHDGESELTLYRAEGSIVARIPIGEFQHVNNIEAVLSTAIEIRGT